MTVSTFYASSDQYHTSSDATYSNADTGPKDSTDTTGTTMRIGQKTGYDIYQARIVFDTSSIPDADVISAAVFSIYITDDQSATNFTLYFIMSDVDGIWIASGATLSSIQAQGSQAGSFLYTSGITASAYNDMTMTSTGRSVVSKTGNTVFDIGSSSRQGTTPTGNEYVVFSASEQSGTTQDPKFVVTHDPLGHPVTKRAAGVKYMFGGAGTFPSIQRW